MSRGGSAKIDYVNSVTEFFECGESPNAVTASERFPSFEVDIAYPYYFNLNPIYVAI
jgi:hypothetical protein